ncbi:MAG: DUF6438 domain-containing protein [Chitinophagales bacterium]|nr:DUF6438 domain-containing protein [Chitinophagales bacterium]
MKFMLFWAIVFLLAACSTNKPTTTVKPSSVDNYKMAETPPSIQEPAPLPNDTIIVVNQPHFTVPTPDQAVQIKQDSTLMTMSKTPCYGKCPVYTISIAGSGRVVFEGKRFTDKQGVYEKYIDWKKVANLASKFENAGIFDMANEYPPAAVDLPRTNVSYYYGGREKKISGTYNAPPALLDIVKDMEAIANEPGWVKIADLPQE